MVFSRSPHLHWRGGYGAKSLPQKKCVQLIRFVRQIQLNRPYAVRLLPQSYVLMWGGHCIRLREILVVLDLTSFKSFRLYLVECLTFTVI